MHMRRAGHMVTRPLNCGVMRHVSGVVGLCVMTLSACSASSPYASAETDVYSASHDWMPIGTESAYTLPPADTQRRENDIASCVSELSRWFERAYGSPPRYSLSREERMLQLVSCMETKGWHLVRVEILVTSGA
jgi:hypothetical protein